jgi:hypothetical protein
MTATHCFYLEGVYDRDGKSFGRTILRNQHSLKDAKASAERRFPTAGCKFIDIELVTPRGRNHVGRLTATGWVDVTAR